MEKNKQELEQTYEKMQEATAAAELEDTLDCIEEKYEKMLEQSKKDKSTAVYFSDL